VRGYPDCAIGVASLTWPFYFIRSSPMQRDSTHLGPFLPIFVNIDSRARLAANSKGVSCDHLLSLIPMLLQLEYDGLITLQFRIQWTWLFQSGAERILDSDCSCMNQAFHVYVAGCHIYHD
jgi:hypothetical protein